LWSLVRDALGGARSSFAQEEAVLQQIRQGLAAARSHLVSWVDLIGDKTLPHPEGGNLGTGSYRAASPHDEQEALSFTLHHQGQALILEVYTREKSLPYSLVGYAFLGEEKSELGFVPLSSPDPEGWRTASVTLPALPLYKDGIDRLVVAPVPDSALSPEDVQALSHSRQRSPEAPWQEWIKTLPPGELAQQLQATAPAATTKTTTVTPADRRRAD